MCHQLVADDDSPIVVVAVVLVGAVAVAAGRRRSEARGPRMKRAKRKRAPGIG